ncbi:hypothetical protein HDU76_011469 [Blyttiomyces sp. JEL0837]|nr:hypothetical protein HDU76_011469 [Blyttiomyces sp. JEL0837]
MDLLKEQEEKMDASVLHQDDKEKEANKAALSDPALIEKRRSRFIRTVRALKNVVSNKLYKATGQSLENYFKNSWNISRAQVYRLYDCGCVLEDLASFPVEQQPTRERLCRTLKKVTSSPEQVQELWTCVLGRHMGDEASITSTVVNVVYEELVASGKIVPPAPGSKGAKSKRSALLRNDQSTSDSIQTGNKPGQDSDAGPDTNRVGSAKVSLTPALLTGFKSDMETDAEASRQNKDDNITLANVNKPKQSVAFEEKKDGKTQKHHQKSTNDQRKSLIAQRRASYTSDSTPAAVTRRRRRNSIGAVHAVEQTLPQLGPSLPPEGATVSEMIDYFHRGEGAAPTIATYPSINISNSESAVTSSLVEQTPSQTVATGADVMVTEASTVARDGLTSAHTMEFGKLFPQRRYSIPFLMSDNSAANILPVSDMVSEPRSLDAVESTSQSTLVEAPLDLGAASSSTFSQGVIQISQGKKDPLSNNTSLEPSTSSSLPPFPPSHYTTSCGPVRPRPRRTSVPSNIHYHQPNTYSSTSIRPSSFTRSETLLRQATGRRKDSGQDLFYHQSQPALGDDSMSREFLPSTGLSLSSVATLRRDRRNAFAGKSSRSQSFSQVEYGRSFESGDSMLGSSSNYGSFDFAPHPAPDFSASRPTHVENNPFSLAQNINWQSDMQIQYPLSQVTSQNMFFNQQQQQQQQQLSNNNLGPPVDRYININSNDNYVQPPVPISLIDRSFQNNTVSNSTEDLFLRDENMRSLRTDSSVSSLQHNINDLPGNDGSELSQSVPLSSYSSPFRLQSEEVNSNGSDNSVGGLSVHNRFGLSAGTIWDNNNSNNSPVSPGDARSVFSEARYKRHAASMPPSDRSSRSQAHNYSDDGVLQGEMRDNVGLFGIESGPPSAANGSLSGDGGDISVHMLSPITTSGDNFSLSNALQDDMNVQMTETWQSTPTTYAYSVQTQLNAPLTFGDSFGIPAENPSPFNGWPAELDNITVNMGLQLNNNFEGMRLDMTGYSTSDAKRYRIESCAGSSDGYNLQEASPFDLGSGSQQMQPAQSSNTNDGASYQSSLDQVMQSHLEMHARGSRYGSQTNLETNLMDGLLGMSENRPDNGEADKRSHLSPRNRSKDFSGEDMDVGPILHDVFPNSLLSNGLNSPIPAPPPAAIRTIETLVPNFATSSSSIIFQALSELAARDNGTRGPHFDEHGFLQHPAFGNMPESSASASPSRRNSLFVPPHVQLDHVRRCSPSTSSSI